MGKGKLAVQVAHAAISASEEARMRRPEWLQAWLCEGQAKVVVKVTDLGELMKLKSEAARQRLPHSLVTDRGLTQLPPNTTTCLGIGPAPSVDIDELTGALQLL
ncbi:peptidyl-tRNA hydrolase Pth2 [Candidatus Bathyarchaeota archaeon]|nr:peptidyl-tRNA hydrolase Pth2 [Candidatus Bathyarchaeota archaeon]MCK5631213.1 peptidyl-tRNA hydrolase Pth2 [Candidatus Bathyarchaeota archaeon]